MIFLYSTKCGFKFIYIFFAYGYPAVGTLFVEKTVFFFLLNGLCTLVDNRLCCGEEAGPRQRPEQGQGKKPRMGWDEVGKA